MKNWQRQAGDCARRYQKNRRELGRLKRYRKKRHEIPSRGGIQKPVEAEVLSCCDENRMEQLEREIDAVEWAAAKLEQLAERGETVSTRDIAKNVRKLVEIVYLRQSHGLIGASVLLNFSDTTAKRYNRIFLRLVAAKMGFLELAAD